jgi:hypothetical protein
VICVRSAGAVLRAVGQLHKIFSIVDGSKFPDTFDPQDPGAMNAKKLRGIEFLFERIHGLAQQMTPSATVYLCVISRRRDPFDVLGKHNLNPGTGSHRKTRRIPHGIALEHLQDSFGDLNPGTSVSHLPGSLDSGAKAFVVDRFKKVIQCVDLERAQSVLLVSGKKNDRGQILPRQSPENFKPVHAGHLHIEKDNIRRELKNLSDRGRTVSALANDFDIFVFLQPEPDATPRQRLIIHNYCAHVVSSTLCAIFRKGNSMMT